MALREMHGSCQTSVSFAHPLLMIVCIHRHRSRTSDFNGEPFQPLASRDEILAAARLSGAQYVNGILRSWPAALLAGTSTVASLVVAILPLELASMWSGWMDAYQRPIRICDVIIGSTV